VALRAGRRACACAGAVLCGGGAGLSECVRGSRRPAFPAEGGWGSDSGGAARSLCAGLIKEIAAN